MKITKILYNELKIVKSQFVLRPVPCTSLSHYVLNCLENRPESPAIIDGLTGHTTSRGQLAEHILRVAGWMKGNVEQGSTVAVSLPNVTSYLLPVLGAIHAGNKASLYNPIYTPRNLLHFKDISNNLKIKLALLGKK